MNEFWMWFWRPIAETLGAILLIAIVISVFMFGVYIQEWRASRRRKKEAQRDALKATNSGHSQQGSK